MVEGGVVGFERNQARGVMQNAAHVGRRLQVGLQGYSRTPSSSKPVSGGV